MRRSAASVDGRPKLAVQEEGRGAGEHRRGAHPPDLAVAAQPHRHGVPAACGQILTDNV